MWGRGVVIVERFTFFRMKPSLNTLESTGDLPTDNEVSPDRVY
jgi:hypothetical protein